MTFRTEEKNAHLEVQKFPIFSIVPRRFVKNFLQNSLRFLSAADRYCVFGFGRQPAPPVSILRSVPGADAVQEFQRERNSATSFAL